VADYSINVSFEDRRRGGEYLIQAREGAGLMAKDVAKHLGVTAAFMSNLERGKTPVKPAYILKLAELYGVPQAEFAKRMLRYRDPVMYAMLFGVEGDRELEVTVKALLEAAEMKPEGRL